MRAFATAATASFFFVAISGAAMAQDMAKPAYNWSGFYIGGTVGVFDGGVDADNLQIDDFTFDEFEPPLLLDFNAPVFGVTAGANRQMGAFVFGVEADVTWLNARAVDDRSEDSIAIVVGTDLDLLATLRGRAGVAFDNILVFATAGAAMGRTEGSLSDIYRRGTYAYRDEQTFVGWVAGGGVEVGITERISLKAEALRLDLGKRTYTFDADPEEAGYEQINADGRLKGWTARAGINLRF